MPCAAGWHAHIASYMKRIKGQLSGAVVKYRNAPARNGARQAEKGEMKRVHTARAARHSGASARAETPAPEAYGTVR